jgi:hypothetical protein
VLVVATRATILVFDTVGEHRVQIDAHATGISIELQGAGGGGGAATRTWTGRGGDGGWGITAVGVRPQNTASMIIRIGRGGEGAYGVDEPGLDGEPTVAVFPDFTLTALGGQGARVQYQVNPSPAFFYAIPPICATASERGSGGNGADCLQCVPGRGGHGYARVQLFNYSGLRAD